MTDDVEPQAYTENYVVVVVDVRSNNVRYMNVVDVGFRLRQEIEMQCAMFFNILGIEAFNMKFLIYLVRTQNMSDNL